MRYTASVSTVIPFPESLDFAHAAAFAVQGLTAWMSRPERIAAATAELMQLLARGTLQIIVGQTFPLAEAAQAHRAIEERRTTGKVVLLVSSIL